MDFIKEAVLTKLANYGYPLRQEGLDPEAGEPPQELKDFSKTVYSSEYGSPRIEEKFTQSVTEAHTTYTVLSGVDCAYGGKWPCYQYQIEQNGPTQKDYYWHKYQSCTWKSRYIWSADAGWEQEESINIGEQSYQVRGIEYTSEGCYYPGHVRPKRPTSYDDRVELKYPYSRKMVADRLDGNPYDFAFLWDILVSQGSTKALAALKQEAARRDGDPKWQLTARLNRRLIQKGRIEEAQRLVKRYLFPYRERD